MLTNGIVLTLDPARTVYATGAVAIEDRRIVGVGPERDILARFRPRRLLDARGGVVHPGLVDAHLHVTIHTTRGLFPDVGGFGRYANHYTAWFEALTDEDEHSATLLAGLELLRAGTTTFMEPGTVHEPDAAAAAAEALGIRATLGDPFLWDVSIPLAEGMTRAPVDRERALARLGRELRRNADPEALVRGHVALYGAGSGSEELLRAGSQCAREHGTAFTQHQSSRPPETGIDDARFGRHALVHLAACGVLGPECAFVHMNMIRDDEVAPVTGSGLSIVWCAANSMNWGGAATHRARIPELFRQGVNVAFGSDTGKFGLDQQALVAYLLARDDGRHLLAAEDVLEMATLGGARALRLEHRIGSLEVGKAADLVIRSPALAEVQPGLDPVQAVVLSGRGRSVDTVLVDGRIVLKDGRSTVVDEETVHAEARGSAARLMARLGLHPSRRWRWID